MKRLLSACIITVLTLLAGPAKATLVKAGDVNDILIKYFSDMNSLEFLETQKGLVRTDENGKDVYIRLEILASDQLKEALESLYIDGNKNLSPEELKTLIGHLRQAKLLNANEMSSSNETFIEKREEKGTLEEADKESGRKKRDYINTGSTVVALSFLNEAINMAQGNLNTGSNLVMLYGTLIVATGAFAFIPYFKRLKINLRKNQVRLKKLESEYTIRKNMDQNIEAALNELTDLMIEARQCKNI